MQVNKAKEDKIIKVIVVERNKNIKTLNKLIDTAKKNIDDMVDRYGKISKNELSLDEKEKDANALISSMKPEIENVKYNLRKIEISANESERVKNLTDEMNVKANTCLLSLLKTDHELKKANHFLGEKRKKAEVLDELTFIESRKCEKSLKKIMNLEENLFS